jgi:phosphoribosylformylglycinamidine cyclo-ligase
VYDSREPGIIKEDTSMEKLNYKASGVDIEKGDRFARFIGSIKSKAVSASIGGFSGGIPFDPGVYRQPLLLSTTDGVGTKLLVAKKINKFDTIGIDLVAMNVNDLAVCGVQPLSFLDYIACGALEEKVLQDVVSGIVRGCEIADCVLVGGETAEMPDLYDEGDFDLAGFCVGIVEKEDMLPRGDLMQEGDPIYALPSSGVSSNGLSLARKAFIHEPDEAWEELLTPTFIYVRELMMLHKAKTISAAAHITGGGLSGNFQRVIPTHLQPRFTWDWPVPEIFDRIQSRGGIEESEMRRVFNMGIGIALAVPMASEEKFLMLTKSENIERFKIGDLIRV